MSVPGQEAREAARPADARVVRARIVGRVVGVVSLGIGVLAGLVVVRLAAAPLNIDFLLPKALPPLVEMEVGDPLRVSVRHADVQWMLFREAGAPFRVRAKELDAQRLRAPNDRVTLDRVQADVAPWPALIGEARPIRVAVEGLHGAIGVDAAGHPLPLPVHHTLGEKLRAELHPHRPVAPVATSPLPGWLTSPATLPPWAAHLRSVRIDDATLDITGAQRWRLAVPKLALERTAPGWVGGFGVDLTRAADAGGATTTPVLHLVADSADAAEWHLRSGTIDPSALPQVLPFGVVLPPALAQVALPLSLDAQFRFARALLPQTASVAIGVAAGHIGAVAIDGGILRVALRHDAGGTTVDILQAMLHPHDTPGFAATGSVHLDPQFAQPRIHIDTGFPAEAGAEASLALDRLAAIWPAAIAHNPRTWITTNMPSGAIRNLHATVGLAGPDFAGLDLTELGGGMDVDHAELHWLRPIQPLTDVAGHVAFLGADHIGITVAQGRQDDGAGHTIVLHSGAMQITGLSAKDQPGLIDVDLGGDLGAILHLLGNPRLHLLSRTSLDLSGASGATRMALHIGLPLNDNVTAEEMDLRVDAHVVDGHLDDAAAGQPLGDAALDLHATQDGLDLNGTAQVAHLPVTLGVKMDFRLGPSEQVTMHAALDVDADRDSVLREVKALQLGWAVTGQTDQPAHVGLVYDAQRSGSAKVAIVGDLSPLALSLPAGWSKPAGAQAHAAGTLLLQDNRLVGVDAVRVDAPALVVRAQGQKLPPADGSGVRIDVSRVELGRSRLSGSMVLPADPARPNVATINAPVIDLAPVLQQNSATHHALDAVPSDRDARPHGRSWSVDARIDRLLLGAHASLGGLKMAIGGRGPEVGRGNLTVAKPTAVAIRLAPDGAGLHVLGQADDLGALLAGLDLGDTLREGALSLDARTTDRRFSRPMSGTVVIDGLLVAGVPQLARAAAVLSLGGLLGHAKSGDALVVNKATLPFRYAHGQLQVSDAHANNPAVGVTLNGRIDLPRSIADLRGTVVPGYLFNHLPSHIPVVGKVFVPEAGGGVVAMTMRISGPLDNPDVSVNPLSILAPSALRQLFK